jgi:uncharacterized protein (DUF3820 family)
MTDEKMKIVQPVLDIIENEDIKAFAIAVLDSLPEYIWHIGASSSGKYHPEYSLGELGLMRHQIAVVRFLNFFFELEQYNSKLTSREMDLMRVAGLVHDGLKSGTQENFEKSKWTKFEHPILMATKIREEFTEYLPGNELELVADVISKHMGALNTDKKSSITLPKPSDKFSRMLHTADYLASRKCITMDFEGYVSETLEKVEFDENYVMPFGKHAGEKLIDVYYCHPDYVAWMEKNISKREVLNMIKAMKEHLKITEADL